MNTIYKSFKTEINPNDEQRQKIIHTLGACRYVYNLYLAKSQSYHEDTHRFLSGYDFSKWLNNVHTKENDKWIKEVSSKAIKQSIMNAEKAYKNFFKGIAKFPKFKKKKTQDVKAYIPKNNKTDWTIERHRIKIPTIGWVKLKEFGYIPVTTNVKSGTISYKAGRFYVSVLCEVENYKLPCKPLNDGIGIDLGIKELAFISNGISYKNINKTTKIKKLENKLKREQRALTRKFKNKKKGGESATNIFKNIQKNILRVQKIYQRLNNIRLEYQKYVVNEIVKTKPSYITVEKLSITYMMKNRHLAKFIRDQSLFRFKLLLLKSCNKYNIELREVDRFYPSSKTCSYCGYKKSHLSLSERTFECERCKEKIDRDLNAAINLANAKEYVILT